MLIIADVGVDVDVGVGVGVGHPKLNNSPNLECQFMLWNCNSLDFDLYSFVCVSDRYNSGCSAKWGTTGALPSHDGPAT